MPMAGRPLTSYALGRRLRRIGTISTTVHLFQYPYDGSLCTEDASLVMCLDPRRILVSELKAIVPYFSVFGPTVWKEAWLNSGIL